MKKSETQKFLIDGFPRNKDNLDGWSREMSDKATVQFILFIDCSEEVSTFSLQNVSFLNKRFF